MKYRLNKNRWVAEIKPTSAKNICQSIGLIVLSIGPQIFCCSCIHLDVRITVYACVLLCMRACYCVRVRIFFYMQNNVRYICPGARYTQRLFNWPFSRVASFKNRSTLHRHLSDRK